MFESLQQAVEFLNKDVDSTTKMRGNVPVELAVSMITKKAMEHGLNQDQLQAVLKIVLNTKIKLAQRLRTNLIKCLIPNEVVPEQAVVDIIFYISHRTYVNPGLTNVETFLLRWVLVVFDYLDSYNKLYRLYDVIFLFINYTKLLPFACHLLFLLTKEIDVKLFRVQEIMSLMERVGPDPALVGLLTCYKVFKPHLVPIRLDSSHKIFFKSHPVAWKSSVDEMMSQGSSSRKRSIQGDDNEDSVPKFKSQRNILPTYMTKAKRQKMIIPEAHCAAKETDEVQDVSEMPEGCGTIPFQYVESLMDFLNSIDKLEYPSQIAACLQDSRLLLLMSCNPDKVITARISLWIQHFLIFGFQGTRLDGGDNSEMLLTLLLKYSQTVKSLPLVHGFLGKFLPQWDGIRMAPLIMELVGCINPCSFQVLQETILNPLSKLFFASDVYFKCIYVSGMIKLIKNFVLHFNLLQAMNEDEGTETSGNEQLKDKQEQRLSMAKTCSSCLHSLVEFLDGQIVLGLRMAKDHLLLQQTSLDLLDAIASNNPHCQVPLAYFPNGIIQRLLISQYSITIARLCGIMTLFRQRFMTIRGSVESTQVNNQSAATLQSQTLLTNSVIEHEVLEPNKSRFNAMLVDMLSMLWQGQILTERRKYAYPSLFTFNLPVGLKEIVKGDQLTIYNSPAFLALAYKFLTETQRKGKNLHPGMIKDVQDIYLQFLDREGLPQISRFVNHNLKSRKEMIATHTDR